MTTLGATATYQAETFATADGWWAVRVVALMFGFTQAARFDEVEEAVRDLIACSLDVDEAEVGEIVVSEKVWS